MSKYVDYKYSVWGRMHFKKDADMNTVIEKLEQSHLPAELADDLELGFDYFEELENTEEFISPNENDGQSTIEVYSQNFEKCIWDNSYDSTNNSKI